MPISFKHLVVLSLLCVALVACGPRVSQENYEKIKNDMSTEEVNSVLGQPSDVSSFGIGSLSATTARWEGKTHTITVTFANDKVKMKSYSENETPEQAN